MWGNLINFLIEVGNFSAMLFVPLFAKELGASDFYVGLIGTFYGLANFLSFLIFGRLSDSYQRRRFLVFGLIFSAISFLLHIFVINPFQLLLVRFLVGFCSAIFPAVLITHIWANKGRIGQFSGFGSLGWAVGQFLAGLIAVYWKIFSLASFFYFLAFLFALNLEISPLSIPQKKFISTFRVFKNNFLLYLIFFLRHSGANMIWVIFPLYLASFEISKFWIGIIYSTNSFSQFLFMPIVERMKSKNLVFWGLAFSTLTFFAYTFATNQFQFLPIQILLALSWSCLYIGSLRLVLEKNEEKGTAVGILKSTISLSAIVGPFLGGLVSQYFGYLGAIVGAIIITLFAFLLFSLSRLKP